MKKHRFVAIRINILPYVVFLIKNKRMIFLKTVERIVNYYLDFNIFINNH